MKRIFKYPLRVVGEQEIAMPIGARILCVQAQNGVACIWALVNEGPPMVTHTFVIVGTGHEVPARAAEGLYIGTFQMREGSLVFHLFEV